jgi:hypothetical protein
MFTDPTVTFMGDPLRFHQRPLRSVAHNFLTVPNATSSKLACRIAVPGNVWVAVYTGQLLVFADR